MCAVCIWLPVVHSKLEMDLLRSAPAYCRTYLRALDASTADPFLGRSAHGAPLAGFEDDVDLEGIGLRVDLDPVAPHEAAHAADDAQVGTNASQIHLHAQQQSIGL